MPSNHAARSALAISSQMKTVMERLNLIADEEYQIAESHLSDCGYVKKKHLFDSVDVEILSIKLIHGIEEPLPGSAEWRRNTKFGC